MNLRRIPREKLEALPKRQSILGRVDSKYKYFKRYFWKDYCRNDNYTKAKAILRNSNGYKFSEVRAKMKILVPTGRWKRTPDAIMHWEIDRVNRNGDIVDQYGAPRIKRWKVKGRGLRVNSQGVIVKYGDWRRRNYDNRSPKEKYEQLKKRRRSHKQLKLKIEAQREIMSMLLNKPDLHEQFKKLATAVSNLQSSITQAKRETSRESKESDQKKDYWFDLKIRNLAKIEKEFAKLSPIYDNILHTKDFSYLYCMVEQAKAEEKARLERGEATRIFYENKKKQEDERKARMLEDLGPTTGELTFVIIERKNGS